MIMEPEFNEYTVMDLVFTFLTYLLCVSVSPIVACHCHMLSVG
jgi:hypothetical protein